MCVLVYAPHPTSLPGTKFKSAYMTYGQETIGVASPI